MKIYQYLCKILYKIYRLKQIVINHQYANIIVKKPNSHNYHNVIVYKGDTKSIANFVVNALVLSDGTIIACRVGSVVKISNDGEERELLRVEDSSDWRLCWNDSEGNVYVSPHSSVTGHMKVEDRGLYRMRHGSDSFVKVCPLYNINSEVTSETQMNDDTFWTMTEDSHGTLYAGVYAHTLRPNPKIYKSDDKGVTWKVLIDFNDEGLTTNGMHIHCVSFNKWNKALYAIVGEHNTIFKSEDGGYKWRDLKIYLQDKGTVIFPQKDGFLVGSDGAYNCFIEKIYKDDKTHKRVYTGWANTVFAIRQSDATGYLYAFCKIDSSSNLKEYYPQDENEYLSYSNNKDFVHKRRWKCYHNSVKGSYPEDSIIPKHSSILISIDEGNNWAPLVLNKETGKTPAGYWTVGNFIKGECLAGYVNSDRLFVNPHIISDGGYNKTPKGITIIEGVYPKLNVKRTIDPQLILYCDK